MIRPGRMIRQVLHSVVRKPATERYPFVKCPMPARFRGKLKFDAAKCIGCKLCMRDCPTAAISIRKLADKQFEADIDLGSCIYCAQCVDSCPKKALSATADFELAQLKRDALRETQRGDPPVSTAAGGNVPLAAPTASARDEAAPAATGGSPAPRPADDPSAAKRAATGSNPEAKA